MRLREVVVVFQLLLSLPVFSQVIGIDNNTVTPTFGVGHSYIQDLSETVNPANGSVSLNIQLPMPKGRGVNLPFSVNYSSTGLTALTPITYAPDPTFAQIPDVAWAVNGSVGMTGFNGWSYGLPSVSLSVFTAGCGLNGSLATFQGTTNYLFTDGSGSQHPLNVTSNTSGCGNATPSTYPTGGDGHVMASLVGSCQTCHVYNPPLEISDTDGTIYYIESPGALGPISQATVNGYVAGSFPDYIEDRNGNRITFGGLQGNTFSFRDSLGRPILSVPSELTATNPGTVQAGGLSYQLSWTTVAAQYSVNPIQVDATQGIQCSGIPNVNLSGLPAISAISLPNGQQFTMHYNSWGLLSEIDYPTGGWVKYTWKLSDQPSDWTAFDGIENESSGGDESSGHSAPPPGGWHYFVDACIYRYQNPVVSIRTVGSNSSTDPIETQSFTYSTQWATDYSWNTKQTTVTTTDNVRHVSKQTTYTYFPILVPNSVGPPPPQLSARPSYIEGGIISKAGQVPVEQSIQYFDWNNSSTPIETVNQTWDTRFDLTSNQTILSNGLSSKTNYGFSWDLFSIPNEVDEFDYGQSTPSRRTITNYEQFSGTPGSIVDRPCQSLIYDGSGSSPVSETDIYYDGGTTLCGSQSAASSVSAVNGLPAGTHDDVSFGPGSTTPRGNATTVRRRCLQGCADSTTTYNYDGTGQVVSSQDSRGATTTYSYSDNPGGGNVAGQSNAYLTQVTYSPANGIAQQNYFSYNYSTGNMVSSKDANGQNTGYAYNDSLNRLTETDYPDGGKTVVSYNDSAPSPSVTTSQLLNTSGVWKTSVAIMDGLGRVVQTQLTSDPQGIGLVNTTYDGAGLVSSKSNPYHSVDDPSYGVTTYTYDALGRALTQTHPDASSLKWSYGGSVTTSIDEVGNSTQQTSDALGRLIGVVEPTGASTTYTYDALNNLRSVTQNGVSGEAPRVRGFVYDSLSRLTSATNPETGTIGYGYDANGNVTNKTDARGISTSYSYDNLNRLVGKQYNDGTPAACFQYDTSSVNGIGHLASEWTQAGACPASGGPLDSALTKSIMTAYDAMGRLNTEQECPWGGCSSTSAPTLQYGYDLAGHRTTFTDAANTTLSTPYDGAGRPANLTSTLWDVNHPETIFLPYSYGPMGLLTSALGNGLYEVRSYTNRGQIQSYSASHQSNSQPVSAISGIVDVVRNHEDGGNALPQNGLLDAIGWAYNSAGCPLGSVEVDLDSQSIGLASINASRPDVQQALGGGAQFANCGWTYTGSIGETTPGTHTINVYGIDSDGNRGLLYNQYQITVSANGPPVGSEDAAINPNDNSQNILSGGLLAAYGWAIDSQMRAPVGAVKVLVDGTPIGFASLGLPRPDIAAEANDQRYLNSGWNFLGGIGNLSPGQHTVSSVIYDTGGNEVSPQTPRQITIVADPNTIAGDFTISSPASGQMVPAGGSLGLNGWALESNYAPCATITRVEVWIDSKLQGTAQIGIARQDVANAFQNPNCLNSGFTFSGKITGVDPGPHLVFVRVYDHSGGSIQLQPTPFIVVSGKLPPSSVSNPLPTQYSFSLGYYPNGNVAYSYDSVNGNWSYLYDSVNRLSAAGSAFQNALAWGYDSFGNMLTQTVTAGYGISTQKSFSQANNRFDQVCYDAAGNQLADWGCNPGGVQQYSFDAEGRMSSAGYNAIQYVYDAEGRRVAKQSGGQATAFYLYDNEGHQVADLDGTGAILRRQIYLGDVNLATYDDQQHTTIFAMNDWLGTQRARVDMTSTLCQTTTSQPFGDGQQTSGTCSPSNRFFTGKERDGESGLDYFGARYYASNMGRFMSPDWDAQAEPVPYAKLDNPQSLNLYSYMQNNPLGGIDADGHWPMMRTWDPDWWRQVGSNFKSLGMGVAKGLVNMINMVQGDCSCQANTVSPMAPSNGMEAAGMLSSAVVVPGISISVSAAAAPALETESVASTSLIQSNAAQGAAWEDAVGASLRQTDPNTASQVTLETQSGVRTRMDFVSQDANGNVSLTEAKSSATARLTPNQAAAHPEIANTGATVVGQGKPGYPGGTQIPPTTVNVVRPPQ